MGFSRTSDGHSRVAPSHGPSHSDPRVYAVPRRVAFRSVVTTPHVNRNGPGVRADLDSGLRENRVEIHLGPLLQVGRGLQRRADRRGVVLERRHCLEKQREIDDGRRPEDVN